MDTALRQVAYLQPLDDTRRAHRERPAVANAVAGGLGWVADGRRLRLIELTAVRHPPHRARLPGVQLASRWFYSASASPLSAAAYNGNLANTDRCLTCGKREPPWGVEPQTYALRVRATAARWCAPSPSAHVEKRTALTKSHGATPFEATEEATTIYRAPSRPCSLHRCAPHASGRDTMWCRSGTCWPK